MKFVVAILVLSIFGLVLFNIKMENSKSIEHIIENDLAYPMSSKDVIKKIGKPDSISIENYDSGLFGVKKNKIYHHKGYKLIFSSDKYHGIKQYN